MQQLFRSLPSVDLCLNSLLHHELLLQQVPRALLREAVNAYLDSLRHAIKHKRINQPEALHLEAIMPQLTAFCRKHCESRLKRVLNATGVVVHTNMGRSVLAPEAVAAVERVAADYSNLELDLATGDRGSRYSHIEELICKLTGAEAALVVNNNAAAVLLVLSALCHGKEVVLARGQLVEIGGSFRIPEVMSQGGAMLREVGCTNRVHLADYQSAITENSGALMRVHTSNYRVIGFHTDVGVADLAELAHKHGLLMLENLGSGSLIDLSAYGLHGEPTARSVVEEGADVVCFSGDKVLGGPQAGLIAGKAELIARIKKHPLTRAVRIDKLTLAALEATLRLYLDPQEAIQRIPTLAMLTASPEQLESKAKNLLRLVRRELKELATASLVPGSSRVGGGAFPEHDLPTSLVAIQPLHHSPQRVKEALLETSPPAIVRLENDALLLDPRTIRPDENKLLCEALRQALA